MTVWEYDDPIYMTSKVDRLGRRTEYLHDALGRLKTETWKAPGGAVVNVLSYTFDDNGNLLTGSKADVGQYLSPAELWSQVSLCANNQ